MSYEIEQINKWKFWEKPGKKQQLKMTHKKKDKKNLSLKNQQTKVLLVKVLSYLMLRCSVKTADKHLGEIKRKKLMGGK